MEKNSWISINQIWFSNTKIGKSILNAKKKKTKEKRSLESDFTILEKNKA